MKTPQKTYAIALALTCCLAATLKAQTSSTTGFDNGANWTGNENGTFNTTEFKNGVLTLTDLAGSYEFRTAWFDVPVYIGGFEASFTYQYLGGNGGNGIYFCLQNSPTGTAAIGSFSGQGDLGGLGIEPSWELELNLPGSGYDFSTNGNCPGNNDWPSGGGSTNWLPTGSVNLASGDPINVTLTYDNGTNLSVTMTDPVAETSFSTNEAINIPTAVGETNTAYVGFTGGATGGWISYQIITNFTFVGAATPSTILISIDVSSPITASKGSTVQIPATITTFSSAPLGDQWQFSANEVSWTNLANSASMTGAQSNVLTIADIQPTATGYYQLVVTNSSGAVTSSVVTMTVVSGVAIVSNISNTNVTLFAGGSASFSIGAVGVPPIAYQWYSNDVAIAGAAGSNYSLSNAQPPNTTNYYYCVAESETKDLYATSSVAQVTIIPDPTAAYPQAVMAAHPVGWWRLNEGPDNGSGNDGVIAHDYWGGNNGLYTNAVLAQPGYDDPLEPNQTSVGFGSSSSQNSDVFAIPSNVDFSASSGSASVFSIQVWVKGTSGQSSDAGLVSKGWGGGGEQFDMDCGSDTTNAHNPSPHSYRFLVRDASDNAYAVNSDVNPSDTLWHHLVGVCDQSQGYVAFYIDGKLVGTNTIGANAGILASTNSMLIGARPSSDETTNNDDQFGGYIDDVAVYNYALTAAQVLNQYTSSAIPATLIVQPTNATVDEYGTATFSVTVSGSAPLTNQWFVNGQLIPGATNTTLVLSNVPSSDNGNNYYLTTINVYNSGVPAQSSTAMLTVVSGLPQFLTQPPSPTIVVGQALQLSATVYGTLPMDYQWEFSTNEAAWTSLENSATVSGAQSNVLTIVEAPASSAGFYQLVVSNSYGAVASSAAQVTMLPLDIGDGTNWGFAAGGTFNTSEFTNGVLTLTDTNGSYEERSAWFDDPVYIGAFEASFTFQYLGGNGGNGWNFCLQNNTNTQYGGVLNALGLFNGGTGNAIGGIEPSWELEVNLPSGPGYDFSTNGNYPGNNYWPPGGGSTNWQPTGSVNLESGDPINVTLTYNGQTLIMTMADPVAETTFSTNEVIDMATAVGGTNYAYVGFTGGATGGWISYQIITNFTFASLIPGWPEIAGLPIQVVATEGSTVQIAALVAGYGDLPMSYQWQFRPTNVVSWTSLVNGATVSGARSNVLTIASAQASSAGFYQLIVSNINGAVTSTVAQLQVTPVTVASNPLTFGNGEDWGTSGGGPYTTVEFTNGVLTLTDAGGSDEARGFWFEDPVYIGAFKASFTYQDVAGGSGNGATFCLQNNTHPGYGGFTQALGWNSGLGVAGIEPSWELEWSALPAWTDAVGYCFSTNGNCPGLNDWPTGGGPAAYLPTGAVNLSSGDPINVTLTYNGTTLSMTMTDTVESTSFGTNQVINIPTAVGGNSTAYVGFTGGSTGGWIFTQIITNFTFVSLATPSIQISGANALISWSQLIPGYTLQENSNLAGTNWVNVTNAVESVNGQYQVLLPPSGTDQFYRLILPSP